MRRNIAAETTVREKFTELSGFLDEGVRRLWAATEAKAVGFGGDALVAAATGMARQTIRKGRRELEAGIDPSAPLRRPGAGRKKLEQEQPGLREALDALVEPLTRGDPMSPLRWTSKSAAKLTAELREQGRTASISWVGRMLRRMGYSQRALRKTREGESHPDRNAQFEHINATAKDFLEHGQPVISVDTKKKELVGDFKNGGREWQHKHEPEKVLVHDFLTDALGKAIPYGVYDMGRNEAFVSVGCDHDTPAFAVAAIRRWWATMGSPAYPEAKEIQGRAAEVRRRLRIEGPRVAPPAGNEQVEQDRA